MTDYLQVAVEAARRAAAIQLDYLGRARVDTKSGFNDLVTEADRLCEQAIRETLLTAFPHHGFVGEEGGRNPSATSDFRWYVDPIDGTTNYAHGVPVFAVSIGLEDPDGLRVGVIYAPALDEMYTAERAKGAFLNGKPIRVSRQTRLEESLLATGFPYRIGTDEPRNLGEFRHATVRSRGVRRLGSAAIDLAWVAAGRLDGYWELELNAWDVAAGVLLVSEAGGRVTRMSGEPFALEDTDLAVSNGLIHGEMLEVLSRAGSEQRTGCRGR